MTAGTEADGDGDALLTGLSWLALEVKYLEPARRFYEETLALSVREDRERPGPVPEPEGEAGTEVTYAAGDADLVLRRPRAVPRGGIHTHFALSIPAAEYDDWWADLEAAGFDLDEATFGPSRSLYCYDPDGNCVELGQQDVDGPGIDGIFEIALEVADLERSTTFYRDLGFETVDRGEDRERIRLQGPVALELWEPQLGIADARGGVHVDVGFESGALDAVVDAVGDRACSVDRREGAVVVRDPDGHHLTFHEPREST